MYREFKETQAHKVLLAFKGSKDYKVPLEFRVFKVPRVIPGFKV